VAGVTLLQPAGADPESAAETLRDELTAPTRLAADDS